jgi:hypothetical protein
MRIARNQPSDVIGDLVAKNLWYNVFGTEDAKDKLGGQPFDNTHRWYSGSRNDFFLNLLVKRYPAHPDATMEVAANYETSGELIVPLVTMHTTGDPLVPYWHEPLYRWKAFVAGSGPMHNNLPVFRNGHCNFTATETLFGFALLALKVNAQGP